MKNHYALTGNIGSGKSTIAHLLLLMGIPIYNSDNEAKKFLAQRSVIDQLSTAIGMEILDNEHRINHSKFAALIFENPSFLEKANTIIHPLVMADYQKWKSENNQTPFTIFESAIIFEHQFESHFDGVIDVYCPDDLAIERAVKRGFQSLEDVEKRLSRQMNTELKKEKADFVIHNYGNHSLIAQVLSISDQLSTKSR